MGKDQRRDIYMKHLQIFEDYKAKQDTKLLNYTKITTF